MSLRVNPKSTSGAATGGFWIYRGPKVVGFDIMLNKLEDIDNRCGSLKK